MSATPPLTPIAEWYYAFKGDKVGPLFRSEIIRRFHQGLLDRKTLVWAPSEVDWTPLGKSSLGSELDTETEVTQPARQRRPQMEDELIAQVQKVDIAITVCVSLFTCGIFGLIAFYRVGKGYQQVTQSDKKFDNLFWLYIGLQIFGYPTIFFGIGIIALMASVVVGAMLLSEVLRMRDEIAAPLLAPAELHSRETHLSLFGAGCVTSIIGIGSIILLVQAIFFFEDHNKVAHAAFAEDW